jgi:hypothetical protein
MEYLVYHFLSDLSLPANLGYLLAAASGACDGTNFCPLIQDSLSIGGRSLISGQGYASIGAFINDLFRLAITIGAVIAVLEFVYGGIAYMGREAGGMEVHGSRERITNAVLGLLMLLATWVVFNQINPQILTFGEQLINQPIAPNPPSGQRTNTSGTTTQTQQGTTATPQSCTSPNGLSGMTNSSGGCDAFPL